MIYLLAFLHAIPVLAVGLSGRQGSTIATAAIMAGIGVFTGNPAYMAVDLVAVGLALAYCLSQERNEIPAKRFERDDLEAQAPVVSGIYSNVGLDARDFATANRLSSIYDARICSYGVNPRTISPDLHATICSSFERRAECTANERRLVGAQRTDYVESSIRSVADFVALCCIGPQRYDYAWSGTPSKAIIEELARVVKRDGYEEPFEMKIVYALDQSGHLSADFMPALMAEGSRIFQYHSQRYAELRAKAYPAGYIPEPIVIVRKSSQNKESSQPDEPH